MARALRDAGHAVTVLTTTPSPGEPWQADMEGMRVVHAPTTAVMPGLDPLRRMLAQAIAAMSPGAPGRALSVLGDLLLPLDHAHRWAEPLEQLAERVGPQDVVVASGPRWSMFEVGAALAERWKALFVPDYRDPWNVAMPEVALHAVTHLGRGVVARLRARRRIAQERRIVGRAHAITAATPTVLQNALRIVGDKPGMVVFNGFEPRPLQQAPPRNDQFTVVHTGSVYREQEWHVLDEALELLQRERPEVAARSVLLMVGVRTDQDAALAVVERLLARRPLVERLDRMAPASVRDLQSRADALVHVGFTGKEGILPLKLIEYLDAGPVLWQVSTGRSIQEEVVERTRAGVVLTSARAVVDQWCAQYVAWRNGTPLRSRPDAAALAELHWSHQMARHEAFVRARYALHQGFTG